MENSKFYFKEKSVKVDCELYAQVCYETVGGYTNTANFKFISYSIDNGDSYLWLTANGNVNYMYLCTDWSGYSFESKPSAAELFVGMQSPHSELSHVDVHSVLKRKEDICEAAVLEYRDILELAAGSIPNFV